MLLSLQNILLLQTDIVDSTCNVISLSNVDELWSKKKRKKHHPSQIKTKNTDSGLKGYPGRVTTINQWAKRRRRSQ